MKIFQSFLCLLGFLVVSPLAESHSRFETPQKTLQWTQRLERLALSLQKGEISIPDARNVLTEIFAHVSSESLNRKTQSLAGTLTHRPLGVKSRTLSFGKNFKTTLLVFSPGAMIPPHSHDGIITLSYVIKGKVRVETYDRIFDGRDHAILSVARSRILTKGRFSVISDREDNVHHFVAGREGVQMLGISIVQNAGAKAAASERSYLDLVHSEKISDGKIRAKRISQPEAVRLYSSPANIDLTEAKFTIRGTSGIF